jgi:hypothetical protein
VLDLGILANRFDNNIGLVVELRESRSDSDNRYQQRSFDCLPYQQRPPTSDGHKHRNIICNAFIGASLMPDYVVQGCTRFEGGFNLVI